MDLVKLLYQPVIAGAARRALAGRVRTRQAPDKGRFTRRDVDGLLLAAWRRYDLAIPDLKPQPTLGSRMNVRLACFTLSFFEALLVSDVERQYATELVADAAWNIYEWWARLALVVGHLTGGKSSALAFATTSKRGRTNPSLRFPFNTPGYLIRSAPMNPGTAFDVVHCPVAEYFRERGADDLCVASWCNLDYALADITHERLIRTETLAQGGKRCDFRVLPIDTRPGACTAGGMPQAR
jgi:hypothetical protein